MRWDGESGNDGETRDEWISGYVVRGYHGGSESGVVGNGAIVDEERGLIGVEYSPRKAVQCWRTWLFLAESQLKKLVYGKKARACLH